MNIIKVKAADVRLGDMVNCYSSTGMTSWCKVREVIVNHTLKRVFIHTRENILRYNPESKIIVWRKDHL